MTTSSYQGDRERTNPGPAPTGHQRAWFLLVGALAIHITDEALTGFLEFYNPLVLSIRSRVPWFPMPTFTFRSWLGGLAALVLVLVALGWPVRRGAPGTRVASWALVSIMFLNGLAHLGGSVYFRQWLPGTTSAPLLLACSVLLGRRTWARAQSTASQLKHAV